MSSSRKSTMFVLWNARRCTHIHAVLFLFVLQQLFQPSQAQDPFDCHVSFDNGTNYDLTSLAGELVVSRLRDTPPTKTVDEVRFNLCGDLAKRDGVADNDQCPTGTRACLSMINQKSSEGDRVIAIVPLAVSSKLQPDISIIRSPNKGLNLIFHGDTYPTTPNTQQSLDVTLLCDTQLSDPSFVSYNGSQLRLQWRTPAGCEIQGNGNEKDGTGNGRGREEVGSGLGWFFFLLLLAFVAYFALGAYYNYSIYGATGADLIPHRNFWREVPYVLRDIAAHLCSALRPSPRNGYIAV